MPKNNLKLKILNIFLFFVPILAFGLFVLAYKTAAINVSGNITTNTTWTLANSPYVMTGNVTVSSGAVLTIEAGVEVRAGGNYTLTVNNGTLDVNGTSSSHVIFTHNTSTSYGAWGGINLATSSGTVTATIDYAEFWYANVAVRVNNASASYSNATATIQDCLFSNNNVGIDVYERGSLTTARNTFNKQQYLPLVINPEAGTVSLGSGANADVLGTSTNVNGYNAIGISYSDGSTTNCPSDVCTIPQRTFAGTSNIPYVYYGDHAVGDSTAGAKLDISAGVIIKSRANVDIILSGGCDLDVNGTSGNEVIFTSQHDDTQGGDTNNNSTTTTPSAADWTSITVGGGGTGTVDYAKIYYSNYGVRTTANNSSSTIQDCLFESNNVGISIDTLGSLTTARNTFNKQTYFPVVANPDSTSITFGSSANADILGTSGNVNGYNAIGISYASGSTTTCPSDICSLPQRTFAGISNIPYVIYGDYTVGDSTAGAKLDISAGVIIKSRANVDLAFSNGCDLDVNGTSGNQVIFTSQHDDTQGGDTNNNSTTTTPAAADWTSITVGAGGTGTIDYAKIYYSNYGVRTTANGSSSTIQDSLFESNNAGISVDTLGSLTTARNTFNKQTYFPVVADPDSTSITFGSSTNADILGTSGNINGYNAVGISFASGSTTTCPSDICTIPQRTFAGISNIPYVIYGDYTAGDSTAGAKLDISAGVIIKSRANVDLIFANGCDLDVNGSSGNEVIFTSQHDDTQGGDTNNNSTTTTPATNDWSGILIQEAGTGTVDYAKIYYSNYGIRTTSSGASLTLQDSVLQSNNVGIFIDTLASLTTARNTFNKQSYYPVMINPDVTSATLGTGANADILGTGSNKNGYNAIGIGYLDRDTTTCPSDICSLPQRTFAGISNIPYVIDGGYTIGDTTAGAKLDVSSGVIIKVHEVSFQGNSLVCQSGTACDFNGTLNNYIYVTSAKNDYIGGDTNNDGSSTIPNYDDWNNVTLSGTASHTLDYVDISYGNYGVNIASGTTNVSITNTNLRYNDYGLYSDSTTAPTLSALNIEYSNSYGIFNNNTAIISAENMWWGHSSGPNDTDSGGQCGVATGFGETINDTATRQVDYCPFSTTKYRPASITTSTTTSINENSATGNGNLTAFGDYYAGEYGHIWSTESDPYYLPAPLAQWKMNDNADNSTVDDTMNSYDGTFVGGGGTDDYTSSHDTTGVINNALEFDGTNDYISLPSFSGMPNGMTITFWLYPTTSANNTHFIELGSGSNDLLLVRRSGTTADMFFRIRTDSFSYSDTTIANVITNDTWQLFGISIFPGGRVQVTKNGEIVKTLQRTMPNNVTRSNNYIGKGSGGDLYYQGKIDDTRIYNTPLTPTEMLVLYNSGSGTERTTFYQSLKDNGSKLTTGTFTSNILSLSEATTYYTKAFHRQPNGYTFYGSQDTFITTGGNTLPVASDVNIDSSATAINLTEGTTTNVTCTGTVTDVDGYGNIQYVTAYLYRTGVGSSATNDNNNHYTRTGDSQCVPSSGSGSTENYTCTFAVWYHADPTDAGTYASDNWSCTMVPYDSIGAGTSDDDTIEMNTLVALSTTDSLDYESIDRGTNTGSTNYTTVITNTGNGTIDFQASGTDMCADFPTCSGSTVVVSKQQYSTSSFSYGGGSVLSATATTVDLNLTKPTVNPSNSTANVYWGIEIPAGTIGVVHHGENYVTAIAGE